MESEAKLVRVVMRPVVSSIILAFGYDPEGILHVEFKGGSIYTYEGVPLGLYQEMKAAKSCGSFFMANIKNKYPYKLLKKGEQA